MTLMIFALSSARLVFGVTEPHLTPGLTGTDQNSVFLSEKARETVAWQHARACFLPITSLHLLRHLEGKNVTVARIF